MSSLYCTIISRLITAAKGEKDQTCQSIDGMFYLGFVNEAESTNLKGGEFVLPTASNRNGLVKSSSLRFLFAK